MSLTLWVVCYPRGRGDENDGKEVEYGSFTEAYAAYAAAPYGTVLVRRVITSEETVLLKKYQDGGAPM